MDVLKVKVNNEWVAIPALQGEQGIQGIQGPKGDPFTVKKTFESIAAMNAYSGSDVVEGDFVVISSNVEDPDNGKLFIKNADGYTFITDLSGAQGMKGDRGDPTDVQVNGISVVNQGIANIPVASESAIGVVKVSPTFGTGMRTDGTIQVCPASDAQIKGGVGERRPVAPYQQHQAVFYGLAKASGDSTQSVSDNPVGTYTADAKASIKTMLGVTNPSVTDVQVNGTSILSNGVANVPLAVDNGNAGAVKILSSQGIAKAANNALYIVTASANHIKAGTNEVRPITPKNQHESIFYGLAKLAGSDMASISETTVGVYPAAQQTAIKSMLGVTDDEVIISDQEPTSDTNKLWIEDGETVEYQVPTYAEHQALQSALNAKEDELTKSYTTVIDTTITTVDDGEHESPYATYANATVQETYRYRVTFDGVSSELGAGSWFVPTEQNGHKGYEFLGNVSLYDSEAPNVEKNDSTKTYCIVHNSVEYSGLQILTTVAGSHTLKIEKVNYSKGKYPSTLIYGDEDEFIRRQGSSTSYKSIEIGNNASEARGTFSAGYYNKITGEFGGAIGVRNVVTGANANAVGILNTVSGEGACAENYKNTASGKFSNAEGETNTASGQASHAEGGSNMASGKFAHAEGNGCTASGNYSHAEGQSTNAVAHYTHTEGYASTANGQLSHAEGQSTVANGLVSHAEGYKTIANGRNSHTSGMYNIGDSFDDWSEWVANTSYAVGDKVKVTTSSGGTTTVKGYVCKTANSDSSFTSSNWNAYDYMNYAEIIGNGTAENARSNARTLDWDGNERLKGNLYVGCNADSTGGTRLPHDIQVNGISVVSNGVANIPIASTSTIGAIKFSNPNSTGLQVYQNCIYIVRAETADCKAGTNDVKPIVAKHQHDATFYGLAKAAGADMASLASVTVGQYPETQKAAIQSMLGVESGATFVETVSGTTPTITGAPNVRYMCGEVTSISITPPSTGTIDVVFTSGTTPAVLTLPNTVKFPDWVDLTTLETSTIYEILITDGVYGSVMTWAA